MSAANPPGKPPGKAGKPGTPKPFLGDDDLSEIDAWVAGYRDLWEARLGKFAEELERRRKAQATKRKERIS